ncbi:response regulator receiver domain-containing protein [Flavobacterium sp. 9]|uniref:response regulator n=1 Tax=Flavobacterium sp. 9 TaxID=2035198 RepID=UPI000C1A65F3|nr:response regulator [Flavobacterium sp. 9]PIF34450.1 response regulator receiver domain-containing protein [Flavobacterium sp. 9]
MGYTTIFHIDDDDDDIDFFAEAVNQLSASANCFSFTDAAAALEKLINGEMIPDAIFLDLNMPIINGQEFLLKLKAYEMLEHIPVIILSTSSDSYTIHKLKSDGASGFLTKPSGIKELVNLLRPYLI